jgi:aryl-alcohol dehydrogenase-like predicted oxidoreductase
MEKIPFGSTGLHVSRLGYGSANIAYLHSDPRQSADMIRKLLDLGLNVLDTAASYPGSEQFIGEHLSDRRDDYVLISKLGQKIPESDAPEWSEKLVLDTVDRALKSLRTDRVDVMLLHSCSLDTLIQGDALRGLVKARGAGKIRFAGYSGDNEALAHAATLPEIDVIETSINIVDQINIDRALPKARERNLAVIAKRPVANAAWKKLAEQPGMYQSYAKTYTERFEQLNLSPADLGFNDTSDHQAWPEIAMRFTLSIPGVNTAIIGTTNIHHALANVERLKHGALAPDVVQKIRDAYQRADPQGKWRGQT